MIRLYDYELSGSCYKVRLLLNLLGLDHEKVPVDFYPGRAHKEPDFLALNPLGQIPVLEDDGLVLRDAQAILTYLARKYDTDGTWLPENAATFGEVMMWLFFAGGVVMSSSAARMHDMLGYELDIQAVRSNAHAAFRVLDDHLAEREIDGGWLAGSGPTIADIAMFPYVALSEDGGIQRDGYRAIGRWIHRVKALPGFTPMPGISAFN